MNTDNIVVVDNCIKSAPLFDPNMPYYIYKRKFDEFIFKVEFEKKYNELLNIFNKLFNTKHKDFLNFEKIHINNIKKLPEEIINKYKINQNYENYEMYNILLNSINYSFVTYDNKYFKIKTN